MGSFLGTTVRAAGTPTTCNWGGQEPSLPKPHSAKRSKIGSATGSRKCWGDTSTVTTTHHAQQRTPTAVQNPTPHYPLADSRKASTTAPNKQAATPTPTTSPSQIAARQQAASNLHRGKARTLTTTTTTTTMSHKPRRQTTGPMATNAATPRRRRTKCRRKAIQALQRPNGRLASMTQAKPTATTIKHSLHRGTAWTPTATTTQTHIRRGKTS